MDEKKLRELAERRIQAKQGFYIHLTVYIIVNLFLLATGEIRPFFYTFLFWGIGVLIHWYFVFVYSDPRKNEQRIDAEIQRIKKKRN